MAKVVVVDYGLGNVKSVCRALAHQGGEVELTSDVTRVAGAERLVLPGVGAFGDGMRRLLALGLVDVLRRYATGDRPLLGICLGMQMLFEWSAEFGKHEGLGIFPGGVEEIPRAGPDGRRVKVPHVGWSLLVPSSPDRWAGTLLDGLGQDRYMYFVHSFVASPREPAHRLADAPYCGMSLNAAVARGAVTGCQFHPEKSGPRGLEILARFLGIS